MDGDLKEQRCFRFYQVMVKKTLTLGRICSFRWLWSLSRSELEEGLRKGSLKYNSPLIRLSGFRNLGSFCFWNPQSWPLKSRIQLKGMLNPFNDWTPESRSTQSFTWCSPENFSQGDLTGFIQKIATIFQGLFKDHIRFSTTTYQELNFTDCTKMHISSPF